LPRDGTLRYITGQWIVFREVCLA